FEHRVVIFAEADSIPDDGPAASAVRSIAADHRLVYEVVERDGRTGRHHTRRIEKPGPTGLITTSTRSLSLQLGTRVLEISVKDDSDQTRAVMRAHAQTVRPVAMRGVDDLQPYIAVQRWLHLGGVKQIAIPFAAAL